ncbi:hypothetical protein NHL50_10410 [Acidimicrobiia bacterium EGI L10123]|uniref:YczE/YyaS/YitT family protein n=1 Tax=Salinilacustrithrix flava TaxID=2957203 RepID=UPI003D7C2EA7|nr:hypothetical protein [Acidimicrobiia bacterium EGI L10123]
MSSLPDQPFGTPRRWGVFVAGVACLLTGISLAITSELGVGSWQVFETGLVEATGLGFGVVVLGEALAALALAWFWLGERPWIATLVLAFGGVFIGALLDVLSTPELLAARIALLGVGAALIAVGVAFYLAADLGPSAQDALFVGIYRRYEVRPAVVRFALDGSLVVGGFLLGGQLGAGTVVMTVMVPALIEPALRIGHRLADTPVPAALARTPRIAELT